LTHFDRKLDICSFFFFSDQSLFFIFSHYSHCSAALFLIGFGWLFNAGRGIC